MTSFLHDQRLDAASDAISQRAPKRILDLGCGDGALLTRLLAEPWVESIVGVDSSQKALERLRERLMCAQQEQPEVTLVRSCVTRASQRGEGFDCVILIEVIEHMASDRLSSLERTVFSRLRPQSVVITTPNAEFNPLLGVPSSRFRHRDHEFEWDREQFRRWATGVASRHGYQVEFSNIGGNHPTRGGPSQMAVFDEHPDQARSHAA